MYINLETEPLRFMQHEAFLRLPPLFIPCPSSVKDSYTFDWMKGLLFSTEVILHGRRATWLR
ncbi:hypothetical protein SAMN04490247_1407 [Salimicrobium halophilum]|uniref:Uncharacterized protein n=1 Tax=Salimicrobium halophilum TaxID=86666 RepID=A0A1G8SE33_9BACI|nr:hypothetical protein SAMN04490247_1407 [Salimicrobium halophilum]